MAKYYGIATVTGEAAIANSFLLGQEINITQLAIGDGGGAYYEPTAGMTALRNEVYRIPAQITIDPESPNVVRVDGVLPSDIGGFTVRELGAYDDRGRLIGVANTPDSPKVIMEDGADTEMALGLAFAVSHAEVISLQADPTIIIATKKDILRHNEDQAAHPDVRQELAGIHADLGNKANLEDIAGLSPIGHNHDERYYSRAEIDELLKDYGSLTARVERLEDMLFSDIRGNPYMVTFGDLQTVAVTGTWQQQRIEF